MSKTRLIFLDILITAVSWAAIYSLIIIPIYYYYGAANVYYALLTAVPFFTAQYVRFKVKSFSVFFIFHVLLVAGAAALPLDFLLKFIYIVFTAISLVYSFIKRLKPEDDKMTFSLMVFCMAYLLGLTLLCNFLGIEELDFVFVIASVFMIICYLLFIHIYNIDMSMEAITRTTVQPVDKIISFNNKIVLFFLAIIVIFAAFSRYYHIDEVIILIGQLLLAGIRFIVRLLSSDEIPPQDEIPQVMDEGGGGSMQMPPGEIKEPSIILVVLEAIMYYAVMIALIVGLIAAVCYAAYSIYKRFYVNAKDDIETKEFILPEVSITGTSVFNRISSFMPFFGLSAAARVRQLFYKKVKKQINNGFDMKPHYTANEITGQITDKDDLSLLTPIYEKARYSNEEPTSEELRSVRR